MAEIIQFRSSRGLHLDKTLNRFLEAVERDPDPQVKECFKRALTKDKLRKYLTAPDFNISLELPSGLTETQTKALKEIIIDALKTYGKRFSPQIYDMLGEICLLQFEVCRLQVLVNHRKEGE